MNFLQLVQRLHSEAGRQGTAPAAVTGQTSFNLKLVNWILTAHEDIQELHESWLFRRGEFSFSTIAATQNYTPAAAGINDLAAWHFDPDPSKLSGIRIYSSVTDEQDLIYLPWDEYRATYKYGSFRTQTDRPTIFSIKPDKSMDLWAIPNAVFTVNGEYIKQVATMTANNSTPAFDDQHMAIVWRALMLYGAHQGAPEAFAHGQNEYNDLLRKLEYNQLPKMTWGPPLA